MRPSAGANAAETVVNPVGTTAVPIVAAALATSSPLRVVDPSRSAPNVTAYNPSFPAGSHVESAPTIARTATTGTE